MVLEIDFESDEAFYMQLRNQVIMGIATRQLHEGDTLPSVRQLAVGINMHTVNKAYSMLREEGFLTLSKRTGAVIALDADRIRALEETGEALRMVLARARCKNISRQEIHDLIDEIYDNFY